MTSYRNGWLPEVFNDFVNDNVQRASATAPAINVKETVKDYVVEVAAPGMRKDDFRVHINADGDLTIKLERQEHEAVEPCHYLRREFAYSKFEQTLILPDDVDREKISASVADGVLTVVLPKINKEEQRVSRQITIG